MTYNNLSTLAANVAKFTKVSASRIQAEVCDGLTNDPQTVTSLNESGPVFGYRTTIKLNQVYKLTVTEFFGAYTIEITNTWS